MSRKMTFFQYWRYGFALLLPLLALILTLSWFLSTLFSGRRGHLLVHQRSLGEELNGLIPKFEIHNRQFWNDSAYAPPFAFEELSESQVEGMLGNWAGLMTKGSGFVKVHQPERYTLPPPLRYKNLPPPDYYYSISVMEMLLHDFVASHSAPNTSHSHGASHKSDTKHLLHCFDYLRQAVMCCGDTALEGADRYLVKEGKDQVLSGTYGFGTTHQCKDWNALVRYAEAHANPDWDEAE